MFRIAAVALSLLALVGCTDGDGELTSTPTDPTTPFEITDPEVDTGWPLETDETDDTDTDTDTDTDDTDTDTDTDDTDTDTDDTDTDGDTDG